MKILCCIKDNITGENWYLLEKTNEVYTFIRVEDGSVSEMNEITIEAFDFAIENELYSII